MTTAAKRARPQGDLTAAFAYLRRLPGMDEAAVQEAVAALISFSTDRGLSLAGVHYEERQRRAARRTRRTGGPRHADAAP